ncbi:MAG TPA: hypothetical protein VM163_08890 [bacterium]|nr:hypothetical protein [bacterium]
MKPEGRSVVLERVPMMSVDRGRCTLVLAIQTVLRYLGQKVDYDYLMGMSGAGFLFYVNPKEPVAAKWCEAMRERWLHIVSDAVGLELRLVDTEETLFARDPEAHFYKAFGKEVVESLESRRPCLGFTCFKGPQWDVIAGFSDGRLLCRSIHNKTSSSGLIDRIQPYDRNELWPSKIIVLGQEKSVPPRLEMIAKAIEVGLEIGRGICDDAGSGPLTGPLALSAWAELLAERASANDLAAHEQLRKTLIDSRISLERFLRWVETELGRELGPDVGRARKRFSESFEMLLSTDFTEETMADGDSCGRAVQRIRSLQEIESEAFRYLESVHDGLNASGQVSCE